MLPQPNRTLPSRPISNPQRFTGANVLTHFTCLDTTKVTTCWMSSYLNTIVKAFSQKTLYSIPNCQEVVTEQRETPYPIVCTTIT